MGNGRSIVVQDIDMELDKFHLKIKNLYKKKFDNKKELDFDDIKILFTDRDLFSEKFFNWMCALSYRKTANRESLIFACEIFLLDSEKIVNKIYSNHSYNFLELFFHMILAIDPRKVPSITKEDLEMFLECFLNFLLGSKNYKELKTALLNMFNSKFDFSSEELHIYHITKFLKEKLPTSIYFCKKNFEDLLFDGKEIEIPKYEKSDILTDELLLLLGFTNNIILNRPKMHLLYSSTKSGSSFNRLAYSLKGYSAPVLVLIKNKYGLIKSPVNYDIFGAFTNCVWEDNLGYFGTPHCYLFRLATSFNTFFTFNGKGGKDYIYLNTKKIVNSKYKTGLGFGGSNYENFRIWLDYDLLEKSYINDFGRTYENGTISDSSDTFIKITNIEIWGFPDQDTLIKQEEYRTHENNLVMTNRKIDKAEFLGVGNEFLFNKQYKFKEHLNIDLEFEKERHKNE